MVIIILMIESKKQQITRLHLLIVLTLFYNQLIRIHLLGFCQVWLKDGQFYKHSLIFYDGDGPKGFKRNFSFDFFLGEHFVSY